MPTRNNIYACTIVCLTFDYIFICYIICIFAFAVVVVLIHVSVIHMRLTSTKTLINVLDDGHIPHTLRIPQRGNIWRSSILLLAPVDDFWNCATPVKHYAHAK